MARKFMMCVIAVVGILALVLTGCAAPAEEEEEVGPIPYKNPGTFVQMTIGEIDSLDPAWAYDTASAEQIQYMYDTLLYYDGESTSEFVPRLAEQWDTSDPMHIRFKIRKGVKFAEGGTLTPEDVEYSFERAMVQDRGGGPTWMLQLPLLGRYRTRSAGAIVVTGEQIDNAVEVDGDWVQFNLAIEFPTLPFLQILTQSWGSIVDKEWCVANGEWNGDLTGDGWKAYNNPKKEDSYLYNHANGCGPWKLSLLDPGVQIKLEKNPNYWGGSVPFDWVITQWVDEWTSRKLALLAGDADHVYVPRMYIGELEGIADLTVYKGLPDLTVDSFFFNMNIDPSSTYIGSGALDGKGIPPDFFTDIDVRKAFCYAFDYETFLQDALMGEAKQMGSPIVDGLLGYDPNAKKYTFDKDKAVQHLQAAWDGQAWEKGFKFTLSYNSGNEPRKVACEILAEFFADLGDEYFDDSTHFQVSIQPVSWPTFLDLIFTETETSKGPLPMFQIGWLCDYPDPDNFATPFMHSEGDFAYYQGYGYPELDAKIEAARYESNAATRVTMYKEISTIYYNDAPGIMLFQPLGRRYFTKYIHGFYFNPTIPGTPGPLWAMSKSES
ncbi:MAG: ABC transporter substrate-binding protein [Dehalococcoidia bacterium]